MDLHLTHDESPSPSADLPTNDWGKTLTGAGFKTLDITVAIEIWPLKVVDHLHPPSTLLSIPAVGSRIMASATRGMALRPVLG